MKGKVTKMKSLGWAESCWSISTPEY